MVIFTYKFLIKMNSNYVLFGMHEGWEMSYFYGQDKRLKFSTSPDPNSNLFLMSPCHILILSRWTARWEVRISSFNKHSRVTPQTNSCFVCFSRIYLINIMLYRKNFPFFGNVVSRELYLFSENKISRCIAFFKKNFNFLKWGFKNFLFFFWVSALGFLFCVCARAPFFYFFFGITKCWVLIGCFGRCQ